MITSNEIHISAHSFLYLPYLDSLLLIRGGWVKSTSSGSDLQNGDSAILAVVTRKARMEQWQTCHSCHSIHCNCNLERHILYAAVLAIAAILAIVTRKVGKVRIANLPLLLFYPLHLKSWVTHFITCRSCHCSHCNYKG